MMNQNYSGTLFVVMLVSITAHAADATGYIRSEKCPSDTSVHLHLEIAKTSRPPASIEMYLPSGIENIVPTDWFNVAAKSCPSTAGGCEKITNAKVRLLHVSLRRGWIAKGSGDFAVVLFDGKKVEGAFEVAGRKPPRLICE